MLSIIGSTFFSFFVSIIGSLSCFSFSVSIHTQLTITVSFTALTEHIGAIGTYGSSDVLDSVTFRADFGKCHGLLLHNCIHNNKVMKFLWPIYNTHQLNKSRVSNRARKIVTVQMTWVQSLSQQVVGTTNHSKQNWVARVTSSLMFHCQESVVDLTDTRIRYSTACNTKYSWKRTQMGMCYSSELESSQQTTG